MQLSPKTKFFIIAGTVIAILAAVVFWVYGQSRIEVVLESATQSANIRIHNQVSGDISEHTVTGRFSKTIPKGHYQVSVLGKQGSYVQAIETKPFFGTSTVQSKQRLEKARTFVGNNPGGCMTDLKTLIVSFACGSAFDEAQIHLPATATTPTYVVQSPETTEASLVNVISTTEGQVGYLEDPLQGDKIGYSHALFSPTDSFSLTGKRALTGLDSRKQYLITAFGTGFLLYSNDFSHVRQYQNSTATGTNLSLKKPNKDGFRPYLLTTSNNNFVVAYTNAEPDSDSHGSSEGTSIFVVYSQGESQEYRFDGQYSNGVLCAENKLCLLQDKELQIYDIEDGKARRSLVYSGVEVIETISSTTVIVTDQGILQLDPNSGEGYFSYLFGDYSYCGHKLSQTTYLLCLVSPAQDKVVLRIDLSKDDTDGIDKKILQLTDIEGLKTLSIYGQYIFITPNNQASELVYDEVEGEFGFDRTQQRELTKRVTEAAKQAGINTGQYQIINSLD